MYKIKNITLREKSAIIFQLITGISDNITFYTIARGKETNINRESYSNMGNILKNKEHIKQYYKEAQNIIDNYITARLKQLNDNTINADNDIIDQSDNNNKGLNDGFNNGLNGFSLKNIDFTNPSEFITYLNNQANTIQDEKTKREYLKMLAELLRFKENSATPGEDIQRFYTPQTCKNCLLYNLKADEIGIKE